MPDPTTRTVTFGLAPPRDLAQRCEDANKALLKVQWALEDAYQAEQYIDSEDAYQWRHDIRAANAALVLAAVALGSVADA